MQKHNKRAGKGSLFPPARPWGGQKIYYHSIQPESVWIGLVVKLFQTSKSSSSSSCASSPSLSLSLFLLRARGWVIDGTPHPLCNPALNIGV